MAKDAHLICVFLRSLFGAFTYKHACVCVCVCVYKFTTAFSSLSLYLLVRYVNLEIICIHIYVHIWTSVCMLMCVCIFISHAKPAKQIMQFYSEYQFGIAINFVSIIFYIDDAQHFYANGKSFALMRDDLLKIGYKSHTS